VSRCCPTPGRRVIQTFVLEFPGQVLSNYGLLSATGMRRLRDLYHLIPLAERNPTHSVQTLSDHGLKGYPFFCTLVPRVSTLKVLATRCYRHEDTQRLIPLDSPRRADSNEALPNSAGRLPSEICSFFILLTDIAMRTLRSLYYSIPLDRRTPTNPVPMLSDRRLNGYKPI